MSRSSAEHGETERAEIAAEREARHVVKNVAYDDERLRVAIG